MRSILATGDSGFIGSSLVLTLQEQDPEAKIGVVADVSRRDWAGQFKDFEFDAPSHAASNFEVRWTPAKGIADHVAILEAQNRWRQ